TCGKDDRPDARLSGAPGRPCASPLHAAAALLGGLAGGLLAGHFLLGGFLLGHGASSFAREKPQM
ncbi:MAG: hypothetical protein AB1716_16720, partial [Planctomycetota bacterium]